MKRCSALLVVLLLIAAACDRTDLIDTPTNGAIVPGSTVQVTGVLPDDLADGRHADRQRCRCGDRTRPHLVGHRAPHRHRLRDADRGAVPGTRRHRVASAPGRGEGRPGLRGRVLARRGGHALHQHGARRPRARSSRAWPAGAFDIGGLLLAQNPIIDQDNAFLTFDIIGNAYEAGIGGVSIDATSTDPGVATDITIDDLYVGVDLHITDGLAININCGARAADPDHHHRRHLRPPADASATRPRSTSTWSAPRSSTPGPWTTSSSPASATATPS